MKMRPAKRWCSHFLSRRTSPLVPLTACVIVLQSLILIAVTQNKYARDLTPLVASEASEESPGANRTAEDPSARQFALEAEQRRKMFDMQTCTCGLHFTVDEKQALQTNVSGVAGKRYLTIGIPTIRRQDDSYVIKTVGSLLSNIDAKNRRDILIVIMLADTDPDGRKATLAEISSNFTDAIKEGCLQIIAPPLELYTNFKVTKQTYGQEKNYIEWRAKQNFDYAFLMRYSYRHSIYYMQLEDDVIAAEDYFSHIQGYIDDQNDSWTCLEYSELGFIGKLYRSKDVERLSQLLMMFFQEQPVDYTYHFYNMLMTQMEKRLRTPTLFQHQGVHSSFPGKIQPLKDRYFDNMKKRYKGDNPTAEIFTTFKTYLTFLPQLPYARSEGYFWTNGSPVSGDTFIVVFNDPQQLDRVIVETGSESHPDDILENASLKASLTLVKNPARLECTNDIDLGTFQKGRIEVNDISSIIKFKVVCLQIVVSKEQSAWAIIREIAVFLAKAS